MSAAVASAAPTLTVKPVYFGTTADFDTFTQRDDVGSTATPTGSYDVFKIVYQIDGLEADQDFAGTGINILVSGGAFADGFGGSPYQPEAGLIDTTNGPPGAVVAPYAQNADIGPSQTDLRDVIIAVANNVANNRQYGEAGRTPKAGTADTLGFPTSAGLLYVQFDGLVPGVISVEANAGLLESKFSIFDNNSTGTGMGVSVPAAPGDFTGGSFVQVIPEPASMGLLGLGALGLLARRRRA